MTYPDDAISGFGFVDANGQATVYEGLTKREWFAGLAMLGSLAANDDIETAAERGRKAADLLISQLNNPTEMVKE